MKRLLRILSFLAMASWCGAQPPQTVPQDFLDRIVDDDPNPLPRYLTAKERLLPIPTPTAQQREARTPPTGTVYTPPEYSQNEGMLIRWGSYNSVLTEMTVAVTTLDPEAMVYVLVTGPSQQTSATSTLTAAGADLSQVDFITYTSNTVWIRDYGPRFIFEDGNRAIVDHIYNRPRPLDDAFPPFLGSLWGEAVYDLPLVHGGGNFHLFSNGDAFMSSLILAENPGLTEQQVADYFNEYQNLDLTIYTGFPSNFDSTRHIDMWMFPLDDYKIVIGEYSPATGQPYTITENAAADLTARGYTVYRTPGWNYAGTHYTYTNGVILNDLIMISSFGGAYAAQDAQALAVYQSAMPNHTVLQVDCSGIIPAAGAIHCIMMHVPVYDYPIPVVGVLSPNGGELWGVGWPYDITWNAFDDVGVTGVDIYYSTDGGSTFPHVIALGQPNDGVYPWTVPDTPSAQCRVKVVAHDADLNSGEDVSDADFTIDASVPQMVHSFTMDTDPGWSLEGQWAFGVPTGGGSHSGDPTGGHTGQNVYGYNLAGDYPSGMPEYFLTTTAIDCANLTAAELRFWKWLGVETAPFDRAGVQVSNDASTWVTLWENTGGDVSDSSWNQMVFDISAVADNQPTVYLRWSMGPTDSSNSFPGWNLDDVELWGIVLSQNLCDLDGDGDVDLGDFATFANCYFGPAVTTPPPSCTPQDFAACDFEGDADVDLGDFATFANNYTG